MRGYRLDENTTRTVARMGKLRLTGNVIPPIWFRRLRRPRSGKPYTAAAIVLSEAVYWYRPIRIDDPVTGEFVGWRKRFKRDRWQIDYAAVAKKWGHTKRQIQDATGYLVNEVGVLLRETRTIQTEGGQHLGGCVFIDIDIEKLVELTYPPGREKAGGVTQYAGGGSRDSREGGSRSTRDPYTETPTQGNNNNNERAREANEGSDAESQADPNALTVEDFDFLPRRDRVEHLDDVLETYEIALAKGGGRLTLEGLHGAAYGRMGLRGAEMRAAKRLIDQHTWPELVAALTIGGKLGIGIAKVKSKVMVHWHEPEKKRRSGGAALKRKDVVPEWRYKELVQEGADPDHFKRTHDDDRGNPQWMYLPPEETETDEQ